MIVWSWTLLLSNTPESFPRNVSYPAQNRRSWPVMVIVPETRSVGFPLRNTRPLAQAVRPPPKQRKNEGKSMEADHPPFQNPFRRRLTFINDLFAKLLAALKPRMQDFGSQRMCPFCGLITPRSKRFCLECGKSLRGVQPGRRDARQG